MLEKIKQLRAQTQLSVYKCRSALDDSGGDLQKALEILKLDAQKESIKRANNKVNEGMIFTYNHLNKIGVLLEVNCETDFASRSPLFKEFVEDVAMQVAAMNPQHIADLASQQSIKDSSKTVESMRLTLVSQLGENVVIKRFVRWEL